MFKPFSFFVIAFVFVSASLPAQERDDDSTQFHFPETTSLREKIAAYDSSRALLGATVQFNDSLLAFADSVKSLERPWGAAPALRTWRARFAQSTDSLLAAWLPPAMMLVDSAGHLRLFEVQRNAMHVDSLRGVIDTMRLPGQRIFRIINGDAKFHFVQFDNPRMAGDTVAVYIAPFGRKIFISPSAKTGWDMIEGAAPPVGADSVFDVFREVTRPRAYDVYDRNAARFAALRARIEPTLAITFDSLRASIRRDNGALSSRIIALEREERIARRDLTRKNLFLHAMAEEQRDPSESVHALEKLLANDSSYPAATSTLARVRHAIDSATHGKYFGGDGRANMELIPAGEVLLTSGERFRPEVFFIDRNPVSVKLFSLFEDATGYRARTKWRTQFIGRELSDSESIHGLSAEDKLAFARWAGKRPATPQEIEFVAAGGFPQLAVRKQHASVENYFHVLTEDDACSCVRDLAGFSESERQSFIDQAHAKEKEIQSKIEGLK